MNSYQKEVKKLLGSLVILGVVTIKNCEGLLLLSLLPNGSCLVLVPVNWIMVAASDASYLQPSHLASDLLARQVFAGRKAA